MKSFILRFRGSGPKPEDDLQRILSIPGLKVIDSSGSRVLLVSAPQEDLEKIIDTLPDWIMTEERIIPLPDPRKKTR